MTPIILLWTRGPAIAERSLGRSGEVRPQARHGDAGTRGAEPEDQTLMRGRLLREGSLNPGPGEAFHLLR